MIYQIIETINRARQETQIGYKQISVLMDLPYSSLMRWYNRWQQGQPVLRVRGPKKVKPLDLKMFYREVCRLTHRVKKTMGTGELYNRYRVAVSRRGLQKRVKEVREKLQRPLTRVQWNIPGLVWSFDDTEYRLPYQLINHEPIIYRIHEIQDVASRYKFPALIGKSLPGKSIAQHLKMLFERYGVPLFLKRDNGSNLNDAAVEKILSEYGVIPLNSPVHYAEYNGGIEEAQKELKGLIDRYASYYPCPSLMLLQAWSQTAIHELNHQKRRCLSWHNACQVFYEESSRVKFNKRQRMEVSEWIKHRASAILTRARRLSKWSVRAATRQAAEMWLKTNGYIEVITRPVVLPYFQEILSHN